MSKQGFSRGIQFASSVAAIALFSMGPATAAHSRVALAAIVQHTGGSGHDAGTTHDDSSQQSGKSGQSKGQGKGQGKKPGETSGRGNGSMEDIFREIGSEEEDSDRPVWAGAKGGKNDRGTKPSSAGTAKGDLYGDLYVILRDVNGVPILSAAGFVQPIDANGDLIPLDAEGAPINPALVQEVELGRLNVGRSPTSVLDRRAQEVVTLLKTATAISFDESGRLVLTVDGVAKTIDSPLENLALYVALMTTGTIPGVTDLPGTDYDYLVDGKVTSADLSAATGFLAAAADKYASLKPDTIAYINSILGINTVTTTSGVTYSSVDYSTFSYDRSDTYDNVMVTILELKDGVYVPTQVDLYDAVFGGTDYSGSKFVAFSTAVDDARAVLAFIHDKEAPE